MRNLFLIDGAAGTGKTDILDYVRDKYSDGHRVYVMRKYTTRKHRPEEIKRKLPLDLEFVSERQFADLRSKPDFYSYTYGKAHYGFRHADLAKALHDYPNVFIIV